MNAYPIPFVTAASQRLFLPLCLPLARSFALSLALCIPAAAFAQQVVSFESSDSFEDVMFNLENAVIAQGLAIETTSHVGDMLERTRADVGSDVVIYDNAEVISFCSAKLSRLAMEADPANIAYCPFTIFAYQTSGSDTVVIGYRTLPEGVMQQVDTLLREIASSAAEGF